MHMLYSHLHHHSASQRHNIKGRCMNKRRMITSLQLYFLPLTLFVRFEKGYSRFACERVLETEHKLHILTSTTYDRHVVSFLFS